MRLFFILVLSLTFSAVTIAQSKLVKGIIFDKNQTSIPYTTIQLFNYDKQLIDGTISLEDGSFSIHYPESYQFGKFQIKISSVGYKSQEIIPYSHDLGKIVLEEDVQLMGEVTVIGKKPIYKLENGNITTSIRNTTLSNIGKATDIFKYLPGVWGDGSSITVLGKGAPVYYINNRRVRNQAELTMLKSTDIDNIEIIYNPGSEYDSDIQSVIKIKTINKVKESLSGEIEAGTIWSKGWKYGGNANLNYHSQKGLDCFGNLEYSNGIIAKSTVNSTTKSFTKSPWETNSNMDSEQKGYDLSTKIGLSQQFGKDNSIGIQHMYTTNELNNFLNINAANKVDSNILENIQSDSHRNKGVNNHYINAYYTGSFNKYWSIDINFDIVNNRINTLSKNTELSQGDGSREVESDAISKNSLYAGRASASYQSGIHRLLFGTTYTNIQSLSSYKENNDIIPQSDSKTKESTVALFTSYRLKYKKFALQAGLRYEHTANNYIDFLNQDKNQSKYYDFFLPNIAFSFPISHTSMAFSYSQTVQRPSFHQLDGSLWYVDRFLVTKGNPKLTSMVKHDLTWQFIFQTFRFAATYINQKDPIFRVQKIYDEANSVILQSFENIDKYQSVNLTASYNPTIKFWSPILNVSLEQPFFNMTTYIGEQKFNRPIFYAMCNNIFRCSDNCMIRFNIEYMSGGNILNKRRINNGWGMDFNIQHSFYKEKFMVRFAIQDIFNTRSKYESETFNTALYEYSLQRDYRRSIVLSFAYRFNHQPNRYKGSMNNEINRIN